MKKKGRLSRETGNLWTGLETKKTCEWSNVTGGLVGSEPFWRAVLPPVAQARD